MKLPTYEVTSQEIDHVEAGRLIRARRESRGMSLRTLAKLMGFTAPAFLSDLERGRRNWTAAHFKKALEVLK